MNRHFFDSYAPAVITERPRILLGCWPVAARNPGAIVIDHSDRRIRGIRGVGHLSPAQFTLLSSLLLNFGRIVTYEELFEFMWGDREDGGPEFAQSSIVVRAHQIRKMVDGSGLEIGTRWGWGLQIGIEGQTPRFRTGKYHPRKQVQA